MFSPVVSGHWLPGLPSSATTTGAGCVVVVDDSLPADRSVALMEVDDGPVLLTLTTPLAHLLDLDGQDEVDRSEVEPRLEHAGVVLHDPDHLCYLPVDAPARHGGLADDVRRLTAADADAFARFEALSPPEDLDEAFVELDQWLVVGAHDDDGRLVGAASAIAWDGTPLADLGVLVLPDARGRGTGTRTVQALGALVVAHGREPQYRCQLDNTASFALARAAGFRRFGIWQVIDVDASVPADA